MEEQNKEQQPVKLTITFGDGHTKDYDVFIGVVADGLLATKIDDRIYYTALEGGFQSYGFSSLAVDATVLTGLMKAFQEVMNAIIDSMDAHLAIQVLEVMSTIGTKRTELYMDKKIIHQKPGEN